jgi:nucleotide-binding universal stress UspA family protein
MKILFPTDFSAYSRRALPYALDLCKKTNGELVVLSAYDVPYGENSISSVSLLDAIKENAVANMKEFEQSFAGEGIRFQTEVIMGNPVRIIKEWCRDKQIDLVVMGTHGASGLEEFLIGSNASSVIQGVDVPVLVIPPKASFEPLKKIVFCTELALEEDLKTLNSLKAIALLYQAEINLLHIQKQSTEGAREYLREQFESVPIHFTIVNDDDIEEAILTHAQESGADLIAAMTKKYGFFEGLFHRSLTNKLAFHSNMPVLAFQQN